LSGINQSTVKVTLRNPLDHNDLHNYYIDVHNNPLAQDWVIALKSLLQSNNLLEKNFCFMGFPDTPRNLDLLCKELNEAIYQINMFNSRLGWTAAGLKSYSIEEYFTPDVVRYGPEYPIGNRFFKETEEDTYLIEHLGLIQKHGVLNKLHNHFESLQGTVDNLSSYYIHADHETKYAIRQLNIICHEMETLILSQQKKSYIPMWARPSQITTWLHAQRYALKDEHKKLFVSNGYDRKFGGVYMHWAQIGKTLFEVFRDESAPILNDTVCDAITHLKYYSGEFDIEWAKDIVYGNPETPWHNDQQDKFKAWLIKNNLDPKDKNLSLGYLPIGQVDIERSFGTTDIFKIWDILSSHLDIYQIEVDEVVGIFNYCWTDANYKQQQIKMMRPGYDYSSRG